MLQLIEEYTFSWFGGVLVRCVTEVNNSKGKNDKIRHSKISKMYSYDENSKKLKKTQSGWTYSQNISSTN